MKYEPVLFDIESTGFNPAVEPWSYHHDRPSCVISIGFGTLSNWRDSNNDGDIDVEVLSIDNSNDRAMNVEHTLLKEIDRKVKSISSEINNREGDWEMFLVGFNSRGFDHPYLGARYARHRMGSPLINHRAKRLDMSNALKEEFGKFNSQDDWVDRFGIETNDDTTGAQVPEWFDDNRIDKVEKHNYWDVKEMCEIFLKFKEEMMEHFYRHYDIDSEANFRNEVQL